MQLKREIWVAHAPSRVVPGALAGQRVSGAEPFTILVNRVRFRVFGEGAENNTRGRVRYPVVTASFRLRMAFFDTALFPAL